MLKIYVGNLSFQVTEDALRAMFAEYGTVDSVSIITDRETSRSRGFGFVEMPNDTEARAAIEGVNGKELEGRTLTVNEARPQAPRRGGGGRGPRRDQY